METEKIKLNLSGNIYSICKDDEGHELFSSQSITLRKKDFKEFDNRPWKDFFKRLNKDRFSKIDMMELFYALPRVLFNKIKTEYSEDFEIAKYFCLCHIIIIKEDIDNSIISCEVDFFK